MGCSSSSNLLTLDLKPYEIPIKNDLILLPSEFEEYNKIFNESKLYLKEFELIRNCLVILRTELIYYTGACVLNDPNLELIIRSFLWILSLKSKGNISRYQYYFNEGQDPYFSISTENDEKLLNLSKKINEYISVLIGLEITIEETNKKYLKNVDECLQLKNNTSMSNDNQKIIENNIKKILFVKDNNLYEYLYNIFKIDYEFLNKLGNLLYDDNYISKINEIGINSTLLKFNDIQDFIFKMANESERFGKDSKEGKNKYKMLIQQRKSEN
jgi:hypothetical protein